MEIEENLRYAEKRFLEGKIRKAIFDINLDSSSTIKFMILFDLYL